MRTWIACVVGCVSLWAINDTLAAVTVSGASNHGCDWSAGVWLAAEAVISFGGDCLP
ncbi:MAG: hypothetical protein HQ567_02080 [Candidatus Nealsonbacteria bacterium]|nr:hypothetical protein [Candidatus Nealsonbacteria bacterium]